MFLPPFWQVLEVLREEFRGGGQQARSMEESVIGAFIYCITSSMLLSCVVEEVIAREAQFAVRIMSTLGVKIRIKNNSRNYLQARSMEESVIGASLRGIAGAARSAPSPRAARRRACSTALPMQSPVRSISGGFFSPAGRRSSRSSSASRSCRRTRTLRLRYCR
jgi:hypothetical protein